MCLRTDVMYERIDPAARLLRVPTRRGLEDVRLAPRRAGGSAAAVALTKQEAVAFVLQVLEAGETVGQALRRLAKEDMTAFERLTDAATHLVEDGMPMLYSYEKEEIQSLSRA